VLRIVWKYLGNSGDLRMTKVGLLFKGNGPESADFSRKYQQIKNERMLILLEVLKE
jgi:hypothetical protein